MNRYRLVILDYPKLQLKNPSARNVFLDVLACKQLSYERASETYVSMNSLDMVSTHILIYDVSDLYKPKLITAIRNCYENRARKHHLRLPSEDYIPVTPPEFQEKYKNFRKKKGEIVDCNAWFVDPDYTWAKTQVPLSEMAWFAIVLFAMRKGHDHWLGATNERFKASRWAAKTGSFEDGLIFTHPVVKDPHKLILIESFNHDWLRECFQKYEGFIKTSCEYLPEHNETGEVMISTKEIQDELFREVRENLKTA